MVTASATYANTVATAGATAQVDSRLKHSGAPPSYSGSLRTTVGPAGAGDQAAAISYVFPVSTGFQSFTLEARSHIGLANAYLSPSGSLTALTALFVPFGYDGGTTLASTP